MRMIDWMDKKTKRKAKNKIAAIKVHVSHPDELSNEKIVEDYYKHLKLNSNDLLECFLNTNRFVIDKDLSLLRKPVDKNNWMQLTNVIDPNAYYYLLDNSIQISTSMLQNKLFQYDHPKYLNYGTIGSIIGHEITHALDDVGNQYDKHGNMIDWWDPMTKKRFLKKTECIINQYSNYSIKGIDMKVDSFNNQGENIADNGGMKIAYLAYTKWLRKNKKYELPLEGLSYNPKQMFWIAAANNLCSRRRLNNLKYVFTAGSHSPEEYRIINTFSNSREFSKDFHCRVGSKMNPVNKCIIW
ncbi:hypothetical protein PV327_003507 [Microctonus hyperodae]|uniref:Peptidase M13 C-terminal domain-containing protein n=1 Tax=Microctonus hyperodae TaxID=165561 RepID=A0AA39G524_MICHY|nr:hypothetical protein PV327_003507 [Microctonus hyperodae]